MTSNSSIAQASAPEEPEAPAGSAGESHPHDLHVLKAFRSLLLNNLSESESEPEPKPEPELEPGPLPAAAESDELDALFEEWNPSLDGAAPLELPPAPERTLVLPVFETRPVPQGKGHTQVLFVPAPAPTVILEVPDAPGNATTRIAPIEDWIHARANASDASAIDTDGAGGSAPSSTRSVLGKWSALSRPHKIAVLLAPFALVASVSVLMPQTAPVSPPAAHPNAKARAAAPAVKAAHPAATLAAKAAPRAAPASAPGGKTPERVAADAIAEGNDAAALAAYRELATTQPQNPAYAAAIRILEARLRAASPSN